MAGPSRRWALYFLLLAAQLRQSHQTGDVCQHPEKIRELIDKDQCAHVQSVSNAQAAFAECKLRMQRKLIGACMETKIRKPGDLYYCRQGANTTCCFTNHSCVPSWEEYNSKDFPRLATFFLTEKESSLKEIEDSGYQKCHAIKGYDASECARDCEEAEKGAFAEKCAEKGGFFKCCVRRDKIDCNDCRFCCSLPICTINTTLGIQNFGGKPMEEKDQPNILSAIEMFNIKRPMYKSRDARCLKPDKGQKPSAWNHYHHEEFKKAASKEQLEKVPVISFDINFLNYEDPAVLDRFTGKDFARHWKETYGVDYAAKVATAAPARPGKKGTNSAPQPAVVDRNKMPKHCLESEYGDFARACHNSGGFYKCCYTGYNLSVYETLHHDLQLKDLITTKKYSKHTCGEGGQGCAIYTATHICTKKDPLSGEIHSEFNTPSQPKLEIGGMPSEDPQWSGMRTSMCRIYNSCQNKAHVIDHDLYERAFSKRTFCKALLKTLESPKANASQSLLEHVRKRCKKQPVSTMFICEDESLMTDDKAKIASAFLRETAAKYRKFAEFEAVGERIKKTKEIMEAKKKEEEEEIAPTGRPHWVPSPKLA